MPLPGAARTACWSGMERFPAAVLVADVSGFTPLADRLAQRDPAGEQLSSLLNAYFGQLMALIAAHGGEVITFAGDGLPSRSPLRLNA